VRQMHLCGGFGGCADRLLRPGGPMAPRQTKLYANICTCVNRYEHVFWPIVFHSNEHDGISRAGPDLLE